jgi:hypothetical protein
MKRLRLIRPELGGASGRTAIILASITWLPLLTFSLIEGLALGGARIPLLYDVAAHTRFLVAVPILVFAEIPIGKRLRAVVQHFLNGGVATKNRAATQEAHETPEGSSWSSHVQQTDATLRRPVINSHHTALQLQSGLEPSRLSAALILSRSESEFTM